ncbi:MAG: WXG100 family type VII secretion target [Solobacterium sp.]|nr:WXG100 family type VII secretion target [Solobacterium sp.]MBQ9823977.1 WXG100 family type VII secretion target [Solobacterium sp.]
MSSINISLAEVSDTSSKLRSLGEQMYEELNQMKRIMDSLSASWESEGSEEIRSRFNVFAGRFDKLKSAIDGYVNYLDMTVSNYDSLETTVTSNAAGMQS